MLGPFATASRRTPIHQVSLLSPPHRCPRQRQRQRVTEGTAMEWAQLSWLWTVYRQSTLARGCNESQQQVRPCPAGLGHTERGPWLGQCTNNEPFTAQHAARPVGSVVYSPFNRCISCQFIYYLEYARCSWFFLSFLARIIYVDAYRFMHKSVCRTSQLSTVASCYTVMV